MHGPMYIKFVIFFCYENFLISVWLANRCIYIYLHLTRESAFWELSNCIQF